MIAEYLAFRALKPLIPYAIALAAGVALVGGAWAFVAWRESIAYAEGKALAEAQWRARYDGLIANYETARSAEMVRQAGANERARAATLADIATMQAAHRALADKVLEQDADAVKDPDRDAGGLSADSVRRLNAVGRRRAR